MKFFDFEQKMLATPVFTSTEVKNTFFDQKDILVQLAFWIKKGYIIKLKKGIYVLAKIKEEIDPLVLTQKLYQPSYISLEYAFRFYNIITDIPVVYTSISTKKTQKYENEFGFFSYQKLKKEFFIGYESIATKYGWYNIAKPEKALFDYLYLNSGKLEPSKEFWQEMRIDEDIKFGLKKVEQFKKLFNNKKVNLLVENLLQYQKDAR